MAVGLCLLCGCRTQETSTLPMIKVEIAQADREAVEAGRFLFGHQSVGENVIEGLRALADSGASASPAPKLAIVQPGQALPARGFLLESKVGANTHPESKCADFARLLAENKDVIDVAVLKYCFVDVTRASDAKALFDAYHARLEELQRRFPAVLIVPATVPLTVGGDRPDWPRKLWETRIRRFFGVPDARDRDNLRREQFNALVRIVYAGRPVFDIARVESTRPDGSRESFRVGSLAGYGLVPAYASDGGHLNAAGRRLAAAEFIRTLAEAERARPVSPGGRPGETAAAGGAPAR